MSDRRERPEPSGSRASPRPPLRLWVIYFNPTDCPGRYVVRPQEIRPGEPGVVYCASAAQVRDSLDAARACVPPGLFCIPRDPRDQPSICETWL